MAVGILRRPGSGRRSARWTDYDHQVIDGEAEIPGVLALSGGHPSDRSAIPAIPVMAVGYVPWFAVQFPRLD